jgi:hypothetical protein
LGAGRRSPRIPTDLPARFRFESRSAWRACVIVDVSQHGAALRLEDVESGELFDTLLDLEVCSVARDTDAVVLHTQIRHHRRDGDGRLVVGVELTPSSVESANLLRLLVRLHALIVDA